MASSTINSFKKIIEENRVEMGVKLKPRGSATVRSLFKRAYVILLNIIIIITLL